MMSGRNERSAIKPDLSGQYSNLFAGAKDNQFISIFAEKHKNYIKHHFKLNANFSLRLKYTVYNWKPFGSAKSAWWGRFLG
jgi:hypothetical protein